MTILQADDVLRVLRFAPKGVTTRQMMKRLDIDNIDLVSGRLSKLAAYGKIDREMRRPKTSRQGAQRWYVWKLKAGEASHV